MAKKAESKYVDRWLSDLRPKTRTQYAGRFRLFEEFAGRSGDQLLKEARENVNDIEKMDDIPRLLFRFAEGLLNGEIGQRARGSEKGGKPLTKVLEGVAYSQKSVACMLGSVKSFFSYYNVQVKMAKFNRKDIRLRNPMPATKKYLFTKPDLNKLFAAANLRDKAILSLGLMGQDAATVSALKIEEIRPALNGAEVSRVQVIELTRKKTNTTIGLVLTPEVREILKLYIESLNRDQGWLFPGYGNEHIRAAELDRVLKNLARSVKIESNGKRLSFHCLRAWFSTSLKNLVSDDLIDFSLGHAVAYDSAYILEAQNKFSDPKIIEVLRIVGSASEDSLRRQEVRILESLRRQGIVNDSQLASMYSDLGLMQRLPADEKFVSTKPITET